MSISDYTEHEGGERGEIFTTRSGNMNRIMIVVGIYDFVHDPFDFKYGTTIERFLLFGHIAM